MVHLPWRRTDPTSIPSYAAKIIIHESISIIPIALFHLHRSICELICHYGVERIEHSIRHYVIA